jgi:hypothetical protein
MRLALALRGIEVEEDGVVAGATSQRHHEKPPPSMGEGWGEGE